MAAGRRTPRSVLHVLRDLPRAVRRSPVGRGWP